jgi:hypothetical protein
MSYKHLFPILLSLIPFSFSFAQIRINEVLASNSSVNTDPDYGTNADWIELYNAGDTAVNLQGYYLTDNFGTPEKWQITPVISIAAKGFLIIWADDMNTGLHTNYKLSASGEEIALYSPALVLIDSLTFGPQNVDISYGRCPDGSSIWSYFPKPSSAATNGTTVLTAQVDNAPEFLLAGGFYSSAVSVGLFTDLGGTIRYTLDGSEPTEASSLYTEVLPVSKTTVVRARIFKPNQIPGRVVSQSYFLHEDFESRKLPVVSISTNPENFWDASKGIYVQTFKPEWEIPVNIEFFQNDGSIGSAFNEQAGIKVNGLYSWQLPQKMLGVYFKKQYGEGTLAYQMFLDRDRKTFKDFALRASGNDWSNTLFRDGLVQQACHNFNMKLDNMGFRPSVVYVNGQYMGIHNIREKVNEDYIASNYNLSNDSFDIIENEDYVETGSLDAYTAFKALYSKDLTLQANYDSVAAAMDIENFTDLIVTEMYSGNNSIDHNVMAWKPKGSGKWKWILMDLDRGFDDVSGNLISFYKNQVVWPFNQLMKNADYKKYFGTRLVNHLYTTYNPIRMKKRIDYHKGLIEAEIPNHIARWLGTTSSYGDAMPSVEYWNNEVAKLKTFADERLSVLLTDLQNYGFSAPAQLSLSVYPSKAGELLFNGMKVPETSWSGNYPKDLEFTLTAVNRPGYTFKGWSTPIHQEIIAKKSTWNYLDDGTNQNTAWRETNFNDETWKSGAGKFGYGDTQQTVINYGTSSNKYVTTYFRKSFVLTEAIKSSAGFMLNLLRDDGAVVYLNGREIVRSNMTLEALNYKTLASTSINGTDETRYYSYFIDPSYFVSGTNVIAAEVHQNTVSSSDLGFDLELIALVPDATALLSTESTYPVTLSGDLELTAVYESRGQNLVPDTISQNTTFYKAQSPYVLQGDVTVQAHATLTIEPGVEIHMAPGSNFIVNGSMQALGSATDRITFKLNPDYTDKSWGALCFINATDTIRMNYVTVEDAAKGPVANRDVAAISAFKSDLLLDNMRVVSNDFDPIVARYGSIVLKNSTLHSNVIGNLINVKNGKGRIENCILEGNNFPDTDAIDFDDVDDGVIKNMLIRNFGGSNSDAIDLGESTNVQIDSILIYNIFDKGVSVGLRTTLAVNHATIMNTTLGFGIKDSSTVHANACTFYNVGTPVANYEKIIGRAGGNAYVTNCIMSNSYNRSYTSDNRSYTLISNSFSDTDTLPEGRSNLFGNPGFIAPGNFDFNLSAASPARMTGFYKGLPVDMGSNIRGFKENPFVQIADIFYNINKDPNRTEFITLFNPSEWPIDLSGYSLSEAIEFTFPAGSIIQAGQKVVLVKNLDLRPYIINATDSWAWTDGSLANEGETIRLSNKYGIVMDQVSYQTDAPWPNVSGLDEKVLALISPELDNHFGENWKLTDYISYSELKKTSADNFILYPNPTYGTVTVQLTATGQQNLDLYDLTGRKIWTRKVRSGTTLDLSPFSGQMLLMRCGTETVKVIVLK